MIKTHGLCEITDQVAPESPWLRDDSRIRRVGVLFCPKEDLLIIPTLLRLAPSIGQVCLFVQDLKVCIGCADESLSDIVKAVPYVHWGYSCGSSIIEVRNDCEVCQGLAFECVVVCNDYGMLLETETLADIGKFDVCLLRRLPGNEVGGKQQYSR